MIDSKLSNLSYHCAWRNAVLDARRQNSTQPAVSIQSKTTNQSPDERRTEILRHINPIDIDVQLEKVKDVNNRGIIIGCKNKEDNEKLVSRVQKKLPEDIR